MGFVHGPRVWMRIGDNQIPPWPEMAPKTRSQAAELPSDPVESKFLKGVRHQANFMAGAMHTHDRHQTHAVGLTVSWMPSGGHQCVAELLRGHALKLDTVRSTPIVILNPFSLIPSILLPVYPIRYAYASWPFPALGVGASTTKGKFKIGQSCNFWDR